MIIIIIIIIIITIIIIIIIIIIKHEKYQDLAREISRLWRAKTKVIPAVVGGLGGVIPNNLKMHLKEIGITYRFRTLQKSSLLGMVTILKKAFEV